MTVIMNRAGHMMSNWGQKVKMMFMMQVLEKIMPKVVTGIYVSDCNETSQPPLLGVRRNIISKKTHVYAEVMSSRTIERLVNDAIRHLNEGSGSSAKSIKRLILSKHPNVDERLLGMQIKRYIKKSLVNGAMIHIKRTFKLKKKHGGRLKEWVQERVNALKQERVKKQEEHGNVKKAGNYKKTPKSDNTEDKTSVVKDEETAVEHPSPEHDKDTSPKKSECDKSKKKVLKKFKPAGAKPTKTPVKKPKPKKKARKAVNVSINTIPPHPKPMKKSNLMPAVSNMKIRKLQQPMEKARQNRTR